MSNLVCECCGKEFHSEYFEDGYTNHVTNFADKRRSYMQTKHPAENLAKDIIFNGNCLRSPSIIRELLNCSMTWGCIPNHIKMRVGTFVEMMLYQIEEAEKEVDKAKQTMSPMAISLFKGEEISDVYFDVFRDISQIEEDES